MDVLDLFKVAAASPLRGRLYLSQTGFLLMAIPNAIGRGAFDALREPGIELPLSDSSGQYNAHVTVMRPEEIGSFGSPNKITERGHEFGYSLGKIRDFNPTGWPEINHCWVMEVHSPELEKLRKTYGLSATPHDGKYKFHMTFAVRKSGVLGANAIAKIIDAERKSIKIIDTPGIHLRKAAAAKKDPSYSPQHPEECCPHCGARLERGDDGDCNRCGKPWPKEAAATCPGCGEKFPKGEPYPDVEMCERCERYGPPKKAADITVGQAVARAARRAVAPKSEAQADAGNYRKGHVNMHGFSVSIETKKGDKRSPEWPALQNHYGYIRRTTDADGDSVDVFLGGSPGTELVFVVDQVDPGTQKFDEHKCMLGFNTLQEARDAYYANYEKGWKGLGKITPLTMQQFKEWLKDGSQTRPVSTQMFKMKKAAGDASHNSPDILVLRRQGTFQFVPPALMEESHGSQTRSH